MRDIFKSAVGTLIGLFGFHIMAGIMLIVVLAIAGASTEDDSMKDEVGLPIDQNSKVLHITFFNVSDRSPEGYTDFSFNNIADLGAKKIGLVDYLKAIEKAKEDDQYKGIYLDLNYIWSNWANLEELRLALVDFKESGKFIVSYGDAINKRAYWLSTVSDKVYLTPAGILDWNGISATITFYKKALEKLGVEVQVFKYGKFKSAVEPFLLEKMSDANREQTGALLESIFDKVVNDVAESRNIPVSELVRLAEDISIQTPKDAVEYGLIDGAIYKDEVEKEIIKYTFGKDTLARPKFVPIANYVIKNSVLEMSEESIVKDKIAVIYASGEIIMGKGQEGSIASGQFAKAVKHARENEEVKAIVLRISSPGGSALASDIIWRELELTKGKKPLIVSMGSVAASGGYYIACNADRIFADANTITGSIGVFGMLPYTGGFMEEKIGLTYDVVKTTKHADLGSTVRKVSDFERNVIQNGVNNIYEDFVNKVATGRGMTFDEVHAIAQGRVWSGTQGVEIGLVDSIAGLNAVIEYAAKQAGLDNYAVMGYPKRELKPWQVFMTAMNNDVKASLIDEDVQQVLTKYKEVKGWLGKENIQARLPYDIELN